LNELPLLDPHQRVVLTGPSGWIGKAMLAHIARRRAASESALGGQVEAFASSARTMDLPWGESLSVRALDTIRPDDVAGAHVIHLAYLTKEKVELLGERQFMDTVLGIDDALIGAIEAASPASLFVASSGAAALAAAGRDLHPYGVAKLRQEARFLEWGQRSGVPVIAGRIFNLAGPHINKVESYAISNMLIQAMTTRVITIAAHRPVFRSFLHVDDLCALALQAGLAGVGRETPVDMCGAEAVEMGDLALAIQTTIEGKVQLVRDSVDWKNPSAYLGDFPQTKALAMQLGLSFSPLSVSILDTLTWLIEHSLEGRPQTVRQITQKQGTRGS
jgi:nucleoside-diphosphate-sugar epimerase